MGTQDGNLSGLGGSSGLGSISSSLGSYSGTHSGNISTGGSSGGGSSDSRLSAVSVDLDEYVRKDKLAKPDEVTVTEPYEPNDFWASYLKTPFGRSMSTLGMFTISLNQGAVSLTEKIFDGAVWSTKATASVVLNVGAWLTSLLDKDTAEKMYEVNGDIDNFFKDVIVFEADDYLKDLLLTDPYIRLQDKTAFFSFSGEEGQAVANISEKIQTYVGASISSKVWGGALAIMLGGCYGSGEQAEKLYKEKSTTTILDEASILAHGLEEAVKWWSVAMITKGIGGQTTSSGKTIQTASKDLLGQIQTNGLKATNSSIWKALFEAFKTGKVNPFSSGFVDFITKPINIARVNSGFLGNVDDYLSGEKQLNMLNILGDLGAGSAKLLTGGSRFEAIKSIDDYTMVPVQGAMYIFEGLNFGEHKLTEWLFPEETAPVDISN